jgi:hypothetical protein
VSPKVVTALAGAVLCTAIVACALAAAPRSCEGGLEAYLLAGLVGVPGMFAVPIFLRSDRSMPRRLAWAALFAAIGAAAWIAGLVGANVRILCRLF